MMHEWWNDPENPVCHEFVDDHAGEPPEIEPVPPPVVVRTLKVNKITIGDLTISGPMTVEVEEVE